MVLFFPKKTYPGRDEQWRENLLFLKPGGIEGQYGAEAEEAVQI